MTGLFVNTTNERCGVWQYGDRLWWCLEPSERIKWWRADCTDFGNLMASVNHCKPDWIVYNWAPLIGGYLSGAPFDIAPTQAIIFHDTHINELAWPAILFSDPGMAPRSNWHPIGRPIGKCCISTHLDKTPSIGCHGFIGAQATNVVAQVIKEFEYATVRLLLPFSPFCDWQGHAATSIAAQCREMVKGTGIHLEVSHDFLAPDDLLHWLAQNTINCYLRDPAMPWRGVSSAPDSALAVLRPLAVNKCSAFRHLHNCSPSICVEDSSLKDIIANGLAPLLPLYDQWSAENVRRQVEDVLLSL